MDGEHNSGRDDTEDDAPALAAIRAIRELQSEYGVTNDEIRSVILDVFRETIRKRRLDDPDAPTPDAP